MIILNKIQSPTDLFKTVTFIRSGLNIILGKYSGDKETTGINGIGKSTLIRMIDYAWLGAQSEALFYSEKYNFLRDEGHSMILEFDIDNKTYEIRRTFKREDSVYFGEKGDQLVGYDTETLKVILANKLFQFSDPNVTFEGNRFRSVMNFFIKDDLEHYQRIDPLNFLHPNASRIDILLFNFYLLKLKNKNLYELSKLLKESDVLKKTRKSLRNKLESTTGKSSAEFQTEIISKEEKIKTLEDSLKKYEFLEVYKDVEKKLIDITLQIDKKLAEYNALDKRLRKIQETHSISSTEIDTEKVQTLYNEVVPTLGDLVKKTLEETIDFRKAILENRVKFFIQQEAKLKTQIDLILKSISELEVERKKYFGYINEKGAIDSIKNTYQALITEKTSISKPLQILEQIDDISRDQSVLDLSISECKKRIFDDLESEKEEIKDIQKNFIEILKYALAVEEEIDKSYLKIEYKKNTIPIKVEVEVSKSEALGKSRLKILAYDLLVFLYNVKLKRQIPSFLVHDGVFHAIEPKAKINTLNYVYHQSLEHPNFQYIITVNEDEINLKTADSNYEFDWTKYKIVEYTDKPEEMFFKRDIDK